MKICTFLILLILMAGMAAGCGDKQAPYVDLSTPQAKQQQIKTIQDDPSMPADEKAAYISALTRGNPVGAASHAPANIKNQKQ